MDLSYGIICRRNKHKKERSSPFSISMTCAPKHLSTSLLFLFALPCYTPSRLKEFAMLDDESERLRLLLQHAHLQPQPNVLKRSSARFRTDLTRRRHART